MVALDDQSDVASQNAELESPEYVISLRPSSDSVEIIVELPDAGRTEINAAVVAETISHSVAAHFHITGHPLYEISTLKAQLMDEIAALIDGRMASKEDVREGAKRGVVDYFETEDKKWSVRWRSRISIAADGLGLILGLQSIGSFVLGMLTEKITQTHSEARSRTSSAPLSLPFPVRGIEWDWHNRRHVQLNIFTRTGFPRFVTYEVRLRIYEKHQADRYVLYEGQKLPDATNLYQSAYAIHLHTDKYFQKRFGSIIRAALIIRAVPLKNEGANSSETAGICRRVTSGYADWNQRVIWLSLPFGIDDAPNISTVT